MTFILDSDCLIKLQRAQILELATSSFSCVIPEAVYYEVVTQGKERLYPDAEAIELIIVKNVAVKPITKPPLIREESEPALGIGERTVLTLYYQGEGETVISDDRAFLTLLSRRNIPFIVPAALVVTLARRNILSNREAIETLERLRPLIREAVYRQAMQDMEELNS